MALPPRRFQGGNVNRQVQRILAPLGPLGGVDTHASSVETGKPPLQAHSHASLGRSSKLGTLVRMPVPMAKHHKKKKKAKKQVTSSRVPAARQNAELPLKRGVAFRSGNSLPSFILR